MEYDHDDPRPVEVLDFWYFFNRYAEQCARWARAFGFLLVALCVISEAKATPVCVDKSDAYKLALSDMQSTSGELWKELVAEGRCGNIPAKYLFTLDSYYDSAKQFSRVVEYLFEGQRAYGLALDLPKGIWSIHDDGQWEQTNPEVRKWFQGLMMPDNPGMSCCGFADAYYADEIRVRGDKVFAVITDTRDDAPLGRPHIPVGTEIEIPRHKYKYDRGNPTGHNVVFVSWTKAVYCFVDNGGV